MLVAAVLYFALLCVEISSQKFAVPSYCVAGAVSEKHMLAHKGWPYRILCSTVLVSSNYNIYDWYDYSSEEPVMQCIILNSSQSVVFNHTTTIDSLPYLEDGEPLGYLIPDVYSNSTLKFTTLAILKNSQDPHCVSIEIDLTVSHLEETTCKEYSKPNRHEFPSLLGHRKEYICELGLYEFPKISAEDVTYTWYHNCSKNLPDNVQIATDDTGTSKLLIPKLEFKNAGTYICTVTYKESVRFIPQFDVCLYHPLELNDILLDCQSSIVFVNAGKTTTLLCTAEYGLGSLTKKNFKIRFHKIQTDNSSFDEVDCTENNADQKNNGTISCSVYIHPSVCYSYVPSEAEQQIQKATVFINVTFTNVQNKDYGTYTIIAQMNPEKYPPQNVSFVVEPNRIPKYLSEITIAGICVGALFVFILLMIVIIWNSVYIRVYYKVIFGVYEMDNKEFGAMLVYNFSSTNLDKFAREKLQSTIPEIRNLLESLGYRVYDENRDGAFFQGRAENIAASVEKSHRVVFFLSSDLIKSDWSMLTFQKSLNEMIACRSKLIFIFFPGVKQYLRRLAKQGDESCMLLLRAVQVNYSMELPTKFDDRRFQFEMRDAMPKLQGRHRSVSSISSNCSAPDYQNITFQRCFSSETQTTEVEGPVCIHTDALHIVVENDEEEFDDAL